MKHSVHFPRLSSAGPSGQFDLPPPPLSPRASPSALLPDDPMVSDGVRGPQMRGDFRAAQQQLTRERNEAVRTLHDFAVGATTDHTAADRASCQLRDNIMEEVPTLLRPLLLCYVPGQPLVERVL